MNCSDLQNQLNDYIDGELSADLCQQIELHLPGCEACRTEVECERELRQVLRELPWELPGEGFIDKALQKAVQTPSEQKTTKKRHKRQGFYLGFSSAIAAVLALWVVVGLFPTMQSGSNIDQKNDQDQGIQIALHETYDLKLAFYSEHALDGATISIKLPSIVLLDGYPDERELVWNTNLGKGDNVLTIPIKAIELSQGELVATIKHKNQVKTLKVNLNIISPRLKESRAVELKFS